MTEDDADLGGKLADLSATIAELRESIQMCLKLTEQVPDKEVGS